MSRPRIAFLNRCYWPDIEATGQLLEQLCGSLSPEWDITVVAGQPNKNLSGEAFVRRGQQKRDGVTIDRLPHTTLPKRSKIGRLINLLSFTWQARRWGRRGAASKAFDVIVSESDPFFLPIVAAPIARKMGAKFIVYTQDVYPDIAIGLGVIKEGTITRQIRQRLLAAYRQADRIVVLDDDMRDRLVGWGLPREKFSIVPNWVDTEAIRPLAAANPFRVAHDLDDRFVVMHSGNMGMSQRLEVLINAACHPNWPDHAVVALVGDGARKAALQRYAAERGAQHVRFIEYQPIERLTESLTAADLHVVSMDANIRGCLAPSKLYGILASGTPVLAIAPETFSIAREIRSHRIGCAVPPGDVAQIVDYVRWCVEHPDELAASGQNARTLAQTRYDRKIACQQFADVLNSVCQFANFDHPTPSTIATHLESQ
ncbi:putative glycosyl transferase [Rosistilla carotiformis]|uniref:Putative glycosyl transferase n=1 Tax=Rosistilla carotiformis TaxID=2528017 RepID=A0A518JRU7_9BACT|nr:glycosyltransferase family 4 protein [Rosistilla carotiformis]QDV68257.1 putative glycosyl transferase [Rosistilla carotiformis]